MTSSTTRWSADVERRQSLDQTLGDIEAALADRDRGRSRYCRLCTGRSISTSPSANRLLMYDCLEEAPTTGPKAPVMARRRHKQDEIKLKAEAVPDAKSRARVSMLRIGKPLDCEPGLRRRCRRSGNSTRRASDATMKAETGSVESPPGIGSSFDQAFESVPLRSGRKLPSPVQKAKRSSRPRSASQLRSAPARHRIRSRGATPWRAARRACRIGAVGAGRGAGA